jgi:myosin heavy subunit
VQVPHSNFLPFPLYSLNLLKGFLETRVNGGKATGMQSRSKIGTRFNDLLDQSDVTMIGCVGLEEIAETKRTLQFVTLGRQVKTNTKLGTNFEKPNDELQALKQALQKANDELQELPKLKEALQKANDDLQELSQAKQALKTANDALQKAKDDLQELKQALKKAHDELQNTSQLLSEKGAKFPCHGPATDSKPKRVDRVSEEDTSTESRSDDDRGGSSDEETTSLASEEDESYSNYSTGEGNSFLQNIIYQKGKERAARTPTSGEELVNERGIKPTTETMFNKNRANLMRERVALNQRANSTAEEKLEIRISDVLVKLSGLQSNLLFSNSPLTHTWTRSKECGDYMSSIYDEEFRKEDKLKRTWTAGYIGKKTPTEGLKPCWNQKDSSERSKLSKKLLKGPKVVAMGLITGDLDFPRGEGTFLELANCMEKQVACMEYSKSKQEFKLSEECEQLLGKVRKRFAELSSVLSTLIHERKFEKLFRAVQEWWPSLEPLLDAAGIVNLQDTDFSKKEAQKKLQLLLASDDRYETKDVALVKFSSIDGNTALIAKIL